ncbi:MAG: hypothetical protein KKD77_23095 [Gammaproteobacteria bacterium]|nr:hypothetical protein [Gammaproteobacteria bacterium]
MTRRKIKRLLALLKAKVEYPDRKIKIKLPTGFKKSFEEQSAFRGWINYHVTWDVDPKDPWMVISLKRSKVAEWHRELIKVVPVITPDGEIVEAEEWAKRSASTN